MIKNNVVSVISFATTEEFEQWQLTFETPVQMISIQPVVVNAGGSANMDGSFKAEVSFGIVVQYWKEIKND